MEDITETVFSENVLSSDNIVIRMDKQSVDNEIDSDMDSNHCVTDISKTIDRTELKSPTEFAVPLSTAKSKKDTTVSDKGNDFSAEEEDSTSKISDVLKSQLAIPYIEPDWSGKADDEYSFDVLKNGSIIGTVPLSTKAFHVFGRLPSCDITLEHPSLSRYHAVVQYSTNSTSSHEKGWYIYDLDSTHGTWVNKKKIPPKVYQRLKVGHIVKFGGSSRLHILQGPQEDEEEESELTITEMKEQREKLKKEAELLQQMELQEELQRREAEQKMLEDQGCGWGMGEDAAEEMDGDNPFASLVPENENLYIDDPKKALKGYYEREGCDLPDYQFTEVSVGKHKCRLDLPVDGPNGEELIAEVVVSGKRKDAVMACALEACRMLDKLGMLRSSTHESRKRKQKKWEDDDFYDSDEDTFLDRTGTIEKKRVLRMKKAGKDEPETYESLLDKYNKVVQQIEDIELKLKKAKDEAEDRASEELDELDAYMVSIKHGAMDTKTRIQLKGDLMRLKVEEHKLRKLVNIAKPPSLPPLKPVVTTTSPSTPAADSLSRKLHAQQKQQKKVIPVRVHTQAPIEVKPDNYEEEDEDDEDGVGTHSSSRCEETSADKVQNKSIKKTAMDEQKQKKTVPPPKSTKAIVKGPSFQPSHLENNQMAHNAKSHLKSTATVLSKLAGKKEKLVTKSNYEASDPDYAMWLPPEEQSGDGRTSLNDKLGY